MPPESWRRTRRRNPVGLSRNCTIFETARIWAYRDARRIRQRHEYAMPEDSTALLRIVTERVHDLNNEFSEPLSASETKAIAASIHRWITTRFYGWTDARTVNQATFSAIQSACGRRARPARRAASEALWEGAWARPTADTRVTGGRHAKWPRRSVSRCAPRNGGPRSHETSTLRPPRSGARRSARCEPRG